MQIFCALWIASGVIPAIIFERVMMRRYGKKPDETSVARLLIAAISGPIAFAGIAVVLIALDDEEEP